jgi:hypothetical protein
LRLTAFVSPWPGLITIQAGLLFTRDSVLDCGGPSPLFVWFAWFAVKNVENHLPLLNFAA